MSAEGRSGGLNIKEIIKKKRDGKPLEDYEVDFIVRAVTEGDLEREQIGALLMAIWIRGMNTAETIRLTHCMVHSGETLQWPEQWRGLVADKHSTGGVGDKVSLVLTPALAACGLKVPMISGRGLGHTGGTLDKLEAIPGFCVSQSAQDIRRLLNEVGCCIVGQTKEIVPADKVLYSSRDVTCTIDSLPLIVSSIVSKKVAENLSCLVLDVKFGRAAFMQEKEKARELAQAMVDVSNGLGVKTTALLTSMHNPLGYHVGNALEVFESLRCMHGEGPDDLESLVVEEGALLLRSLGKVTDLESGRKRIRDVIHNGDALEKFRQMAIGQGVSAEHAERLCRRGEEFTVMTGANHTTQIFARSSGHVHGIEPMSIALSSASLGGARFGHDDKINHAVGVVLKCRPGQLVKEGDLLATVHHDTPALEQSLVDDLTNAVEIREHIPEEFHRIADIIE